MSSWLPGGGVKAAAGIYPKAQTMIAAYKGISKLSRLIRLFGDGEYSHVAWVDDDLNTCWEAWTSGVRQVMSIHHQHTPGTEVDIFRVAGQQHHHTTAIRHFFLSQQGKPYDWPGIFRFVTRGREAHTANPPNWFCSRIVAEAHAKAGLPLLNAPAWKLSPTMVTYSPSLVKVTTVRTVDTNRLDNRRIMGFQQMVDGAGFYHKRNEHKWEEAR